MNITHEQEVKLQDSIVQKVMAKFYERSQTGLRKYGTTLDRNDLNTLQWLNHLQEELMDATLYVERLKQESRLTKMMSDDAKDGLYNDKQEK